MATESFTKTQFEDTLTSIFTPEGYAWEVEGLIANEWRYKVVVTEHVNLHVNSSIKRDGVSAPAAENSIRIWITDKEGNPLGNKTQRWVTRMKGWQERMRAAAEKTLAMGQEIRYCKHCKTLEKVFVVKKEGPNKGRMFIKCNCENSFSWFDFEEETEDEPEHLPEPKVVQSIVGPKLIPQAPPCPKCGGLMVMRTRKSDNSKFWGCKKFPDCKGTCNYVENEDFNQQWVQHKNEFAEREAAQEREAFASDPDFQRSIKEDKAAKLASVQAKLAQHVELVELAVSQVVAEFVWSRYQSTFFSELQALKPGENIVVEALAGSGKTTTIAHSTKLLPSDKKIVVLVFNAHNVAPVRAKVPKHVKVCTYHSLGYTACRKAWGSDIEENKGDKEEAILRNILNRDVYRSIYGTIKQIASLVRSNLTGTEDKDLLEICYYYGIETRGDTQIIFEAVRGLLAKDVQQTKLISFDDQCWLPVALSAAMEQYDYVYIDEAQDTNRCQMALALASVKPDGHIIAVGDRYQSMYAFRGADAQAIPNLIEALNAKVMTLPVTYRNPQCVVDLIRRKFSDIPLEGTGKEGSISDVRYEKALEMFKAGDMVLCRTNAPLIKPVFALIRKGVKATIRGRNIGKGLVTLVKSMKASTIVDLLSALAEYKEKEVAKLVAADKNPQNFVDNVETIIALSDGMDSIFDLENRINSIFGDDTTEGVIFSSIHKAKGLEAENIYILKPDLLPHPSAKKPWEKVQEHNIEYVALTRTLKNLYYVYGGD